ncbi:MAG: UDP-N-acetylglucosamine 2-epimerase (non-hydrolyzing) [Opitutae bacterium]
MKKIALILGTRPECIKMAPVYFALKQSTKLLPVVISTGQHRQMLDQTLRVFGIKPEFDLNLMQPGQTLPELTSRVITATSAWFAEHKPAAVLVQGDTTTVLSSAISAFYNRIPIGHVEAGLRTGNMDSPFPEEMNRRLTTPLARWNFCPTETSKANLIKEGIDANTCYVTGNSVVDALFYVRKNQSINGVSAKIVAERVGIPGAFAQEFLSETAKKPWILVTGHRRESFGGGFERICEAINRITQLHPEVGVLYPVHLNPQVQAPVNRILGSNPRVALVAPAAYEEFVWLMNRCTFLLSDSGGVQEEAPSLGKPVLVMRDTTERPEGVDAGTCRLVGTNPETILREADLLLNNPGEYQRRSSLKNPYGDGQTSEKIRQILEDSLS